MHESTPSATPSEMPVSSEGGLRLGAIDIGSNSLHMVIAQVDEDGAVTTLWRIKEMVGLGRISFPSRRLSAEAMERALSALTHFQDTCRRRGCRKIMAVATSAVREAENGGEFIERVRRRTGLRVRVVSAREEARLIYLGARHECELGEQPNLILDVGGGSAEFIVGNSRKAALLESRKLGAARMTAQFINSDPPAQGQIDALVQHYQRELTPLLAKIARLEPKQIMGCSGTIEALACLCDEQNRSLRDGGAVLKRNALDELVVKLRTSTAPERSALKGMDAKRQDQILAGAMLVQQILHHLDVPNLSLCGGALREGMLVDYLARHMPDLAIRRDVPDVRRRSVIDLARRCDWHERHSLQVTRIALKLFDLLKPYHALEDSQRELLEYSAMLHDIGWHIAERSHHKHSAYLILHGRLEGFTNQEVRVIANIARYHRKSRPKKSHAGFNRLSAAEQRLVEIGAGILRVSDGLDRSHCGAVSSLRCRKDADHLTLSVKGRGDIQLELWAARRKRGLLERVLQTPVLFKSVIARKTLKAK